MARHVSDSHQKGGHDERDDSRVPAILQGIRFDSILALTKVSCLCVLAHHQRQPSSCAVECRALAGVEHTCGIESTGSAWCWGWDAVGQLGDGNASQAPAYSPVAVAGGHTFATTQ